MSGGASWRTEVLFEGGAEGCVLRLDAPISFWGGISPVTSEVTLAGHPQRGERIADRMLVIPHLIGSSSSSAILLELTYIGRAPRALILGGRDAILPVGVVVARQMGWPAPPVVILPEPPFRTGDRLCLDTGGTLTRL